MKQETTKKGKLVIFSAPSGAGKTTIVKQLLQKNLNFEFSVSATCREARKNEINGKDYYFLSQDEFQQKIDSDAFLEWEEVYLGTRYGTLKSEVERIRNRGKNVIFDVDVVGGLNIKNFYGNDALAIFVQPPSVDELENRLRFRSTETEEKIQVRLAKAKHELSYAERFDVIIVNDNLEEAIKNAETVISRFLK